MSLPAMHPIHAQSSYTLDVNGEDHEVNYAVNADMLAMQIDPEQKSLLVGIENAQMSEFVIQLPSHVISAPDNEFSVLVDQMETDYIIVDNMNNDMEAVTLLFYIPQYAQEVEIIGTHVIPEFSLPAVIILITAILAVIAASRASIVHIRVR